MPASDPTLPASVQPPQRVLLGPGPSVIDPAVLSALARPTLGHLDPAFLAIMDEVCSMLRRVMGTQNELTFPMSGTGSAGMETCLVNLIDTQSIQTWRDLAAGAKLPASVVIGPSLADEVVVQVQVDITLGIRVAAHI